MRGRSNLIGRHKKVGHNVIPHKSGVHRVSCFALYKRLLQQVPTSPLNRTNLLHVLKAEFRTDAKLRIHAEIRQSLQTGYQALKLLQTLRSQSANLAEKNTQDVEISQTRSADLSTPSLASKIWIPSAFYETHSDQVTRLNAKLVDMILSYPPPPVPGPPPPRLTPYPGGRKILDRPYPKSSFTGVRRIPVLVHASGFAFLRIKKPQPPLISKILRNKIDQKQKRVDQIIAMDEDLMWCDDEDAWEEILEDQGLDFTDQELPEASWGDATRWVQREINRKIRKEDLKQQDLARKFTKIIEKEKRLGEEEKEAFLKARFTKQYATLRAKCLAKGMPWEDREIVIENGVPKAVKPGQNTNVGANR